jgi:hypothetical protein
VALRKRATPARPADLLSRQSPSRMPSRASRPSAKTPRVELSKHAQRPPVEPADALCAKFEAAILQFSAEFPRTKGFQHALTKGEEREEPVQEFLRQNLPDVFGVAGGGARLTRRA